MMAYIIMLVGGASVGFAVGYVYGLMRGFIWLIERTQRGRVEMTQATRWFRIIAGAVIGSSLPWLYIASTIRGPSQAELYRIEIAYRDARIKQLEIHPPIVHSISQLPTPPTGLPCTFEGITFLSNNPKLKSCEHGRIHIERARTIYLFDHRYVREKCAVILGTDQAIKKIEVSDDGAKWRTAILEATDRFFTRKCQ